MNFILKIFKFVNILFKAKLNIKDPPKKKILIYDIEGSKELLKYLLNNSTFILSVRKEKINLRILLFSFLKFNFNWNFSKYLVYFIKKVNPEFIITFIDNNPEFYKLKKDFKNSKIIFIQNGIRGYENDIFSIFDKMKFNSRDFHVDEMFVWNKKTGMNYSKFIKGNYNVIGSIKNNSIKTTLNQKKFKLLFLSEYRNKSGFGTNPTWDSYYEAEKKLIPYLHSFTKKKNIMLSICSNTFDFDEERSFYSDLISGDNWELLKRKNDESSYNYIDMSELIVFISTAIGYEAISRGSKVAALTIRSETSKIKSHKFGWPYNFEKNYGEFWLNHYDEDKFDKILNGLIHESQDKYAELINKKYNYLLPFDPGNKIFNYKMKSLKII